MTELLDETQIRFSRWRRQVFAMTTELEQHPDMKDSEDLGDFVGMVATLMSFAPFVSDRIELAVSYALEAEALEEEKERANWGD